MLSRLLQRLLPAAGVALAVALVGFGAIGMATADGSAANADPVWFQIPQRHGGDAGVVSSTSVDVHGVAEDVVMTSTFTYTWGPEVAWLDGRTGEWIAAHAKSGVREYDFPGLDYESGMTYSNEQADVLATADSRYVGSVFDFNFDWTLHAEALLSSYDFDIQFLTHGIAWADGVPCGLDTLVRAGLYVPSSVQVEDRCLTGGTDPVTLEAAVADLDGVPVVRFTGQVNRTLLTVDYNQDLPERLRLERVVASEHNGQDGHRSVETLTGFAAGSEPWDTGLALPAPVALPPIEFAARQPWGPDETGVEHPFPASAAWTYAREDATFTEFQDYMAAHPAAIARESQYNDIRQGNLTQHRWSFVASDGTGEDFSFSVTQEIAPAGTALTDMLGLPTPPTPEQTTYSTGGMATANDWCHIAPEADLPTVRSMLARWQATVGSDLPGDSWSVGCGYDQTYLGAGRNKQDFEASRLQNQVDGTPTTGTFDAHELAFDASGVPTSLSTTTGAHTQSSVLGPSGAPPPTGQSASTAPLRPAPRLALAGFAWSPPAGPAASGAAAASLLAGLAYWLWPVLKAGPLGLFSRIQTPRLLDHPLRRQIADVVEAQPGIHYQAILRTVGGGKGAVEHHLRKLVAGGVLVKDQGAGFTCYFPVGTDRHLVGTAGVLKADGARKVLKAAHATPGASCAQVAAVTGLDASTVSHHVARLSEAGLVALQREGRLLRLEATALGEKALGAA